LLHVQRGKIPFPEGMSLLTSLITSVDYPNGRLLLEWNTIFDPILQPILSIDKPLNLNDTFGDAETADSNNSFVMNDANSNNNNNNDMGDSDGERSADEEELHTRSTVNSFIFIYENEYYSKTRIFVITSLI
jgi:hypothetical protein